MLREIEAGRITGTDVIGSTLVIAKQTEEQMGGTSGALYSWAFAFTVLGVGAKRVALVRIFFSSLAQGLVVAANPQKTEATPEVWSSALNHALDRLFSYTRARPPSRTLIDPLTAFVHSFKSGFQSAVNAASEAAEATKNLEAKAGRSAYVESDLLKKKKVADPGAWGVKTILENL